MSTKKVIPDELAKGIQVLKAGRAYIGNPSNWTTGYLAIKKDGRPVNWQNYSNGAQLEHLPFPKDVMKVCSYGALMRELNTASTAVAAQSCAGSFLNLAADGRPIVAVNDQSGYAATLKMWDTAIALAEKAAEDHVPE